MILMLLIICANPAVDRSLTIPNLTVGAVNRTHSSMTAAGGKGFNVARATHTLGGTATCASFVGGRTGRWLADLAEAEGLGARWTWIESETRICSIMVDPVAGTATVVNEQGPQVTAADWAAFAGDVQAAAADCAVAGFSGSLPPGSPVEAYARLVRDLAGTRPVWVDSSGASLKAALEIPSIGLKVNGEEAGAILGRNIESVPEALAAADELRERGLAAAVLTLGAEGAVISHPEARGWAKPPRLNVLSAVGSGDSFFAGLLLALSEGRPVADALCRAAAAGAANALSVGGGSFARADFDRIYSETRFQGL
jgi:1-phosphofructokinase family hexose kinase